MAVRSIGCGACGAAVPYGRLSCPECGELLASVAGAARRMSSIVALEPVGLPAESADPIDLTASATAAPAPAPVTDAGDVPTGYPGPSVLHDLEASDGLDGLLSPFEDDATGDHDADEDPLDRAMPPPLGSTVAGPATGPIVAPAPPPGAYVPPVPSMTSATTLPAGPAGPARAWAGHAAATDPGSAVAGSAADASSVDGAAGAEKARLDETIGWVAIAGSAMAAAGFLLPWSRTVIGSSGDGYLDRWGLAGPGHPFVVLGILVVLVLALVRNPVPAWLRLGIPGLGLGALLLGLLWPYAFGPLGAQPGALVSVGGALILAGAGAAALVSDRRAGAAPLD